MSIIRMKYPFLDEIAKYAKEHLPEEACGLIAGSEDENGRLITKVYYLTNTDHAEDHFTMDPKEQLAAIKDMRANGLKPLGNWHSHPSSPSRPSDEDIKLAYDPNASYMIMSLMAENPVINSFHIEGGQVTKEDLRIYFESQRKLQRKVSFIEDGFSFLEKDVIIACIFNKTKERAKMKLKTKELTTCALFAALIAVGAFIKIDIPLPIYTMHFTLQWFFVLMAGFLLGAKLAPISVIVYLCIGLVGVPVFAAGGGPTYILRPGFGFLLGFVLAAFLIGAITEKLKKTNAFTLILPATVGLVAYYTVGAIYFYCMKNFYAATPVSWGIVIVDYCLITVAPDFILCVSAAVFSAKLRPVFEGMLNGYSVKHKAKNKA